MNRKKIWAAFLVFLLLASLTGIAAAGAQDG